MEPTTNLEERLVLLLHSIVPELREGTDVGHVPLVDLPLIQPHVLAVLGRLSLDTLVDGLILHRDLL